MPATKPSVGNASQRALGAFLRSRRERVSPECAGLPAASNRRTSGLRREEIAALSGVSLTWYTWLEQGRNIHVSRQVLGALARVLRLSESEQLHLYRLAGEVPPAIDPTPPCVPLPEHLSDVLTALEPNPAFVLDRHWDIVGWNRAEAALFTDFSALPGAHRNMLWLLFGWPPARQLLVSWADQAAAVLAQFRMIADEHPSDPRFAEIRRVLQATVDGFATWWDRHDVATYQTVRKEFDHPKVGRLSLRQSKLIVADNPGLQLVVRLPADESSADKLARLVTG